MKTSSYMKKSSYLAAVAAAVLGGTASAATTTDPEWAEGCAVTIAKGDTVILTRSTPQLESLTVNGTLSCSNWETRVWADTVSVPSGGKITVTGPSFASCTNRVWIQCNDITIAAGGKIDLDKLGFGITPTSQNAAIGPGGSGAHIYGAAHGGHGSYFSYGQHAADVGVPGKIYDDPRAPMIPGSGGCRSDQWGTPTAGGGAVYINAENSVRVDGSILAGVSTATVRAGSGSGGSIRIVCSTIAGSGVLRADGGSTSASVNKIATGQAYEKGSAAGGGMIAIEYDPSKQLAADVTGMTISADAGYVASTSNPKLCGDEVPNFYQADLGTVYFTDDRFLPVLLGKGLTGRLVNTTSYVHEGNLDFTSGRVRFGAEGAVSVTINGNLTVSNRYARLEAGGCRISKSKDHWEIFGDLPTAFEVKGDMTVADGGRFDIRACSNLVSSVMTNFHRGARLAVGGRLTIASNATVYAWSYALGNSVPEIEVDSLVVEEFGKLSADCRGGSIEAGPYKKSSTYYGYGSSAAAAGHGGIGGKSAAGYAGDPTKGREYDDEWNPRMAGSGGGFGGYSTLLSRGGGAILVTAAKDITVDGTISADANAISDNARNAGGGSGGSVLLKCRSLIGGANAVISANGGYAEYNSSYKGGSGGGGRVAIWTGYQNWREGLKPKYIVHNASGLPGTYHGTVSAAHGASPTEEGYSEDIREAWTGKDGTVRWGEILARKGTILYLR